jgi:hypothetical protein
MCPWFTSVRPIIVTMSVGECEYMCCVFWAFVPLWIVQMTTSLVPCVNHCARLLFILCSPRFFGWVSNPVFFWGSSSPCPYTARHILGLIKIETITHTCTCLLTLHTNMTVSPLLLPETTNHSNGMLQLFLGMFHPSIRERSLLCNTFWLRMKMTSVTIDIMELHITHSTLKCPHYPTIPFQPFNYQRPLCIDFW